jgi:methionine-rich copper-binding protein CopC
MAHPSLSRSRGRGLRWLSIGLGAALLLVFVPSSASAHPDYITTSPKDGAQLNSAPAAVVISFSDKVTMARQGARIVDQNGLAVPSTAVFSSRNRKLTITPKKRLGRGRYAAAYNVVSTEGHYVPGALAFTIATPTIKGSPIRVKTAPNVPTALDGDRAGVRTITVETSLKSAEVTWQCAAVPEPMIWKLKGNGNKATATGVLPIAGVWSFQIDLSTADSVLLPMGKVTLK